MIRKKQKFNSDWGILKFNVKRTRM